MRAVEAIEEIWLTYQVTKDALIESRGFTLVTRNYLLDQDKDLTLSTC
jgi:hypothetical protein